MSKIKSIRGLSPKLNGNYIATPQGQAEYDKELERLKENRRRYTQFVKEKAIKNKPKNDFWE